MQMQQARRWVVMKFGGTSVSSVDCWETICGQARISVEAGKPVLIVVSALSGVTNLLTSLLQGLHRRNRTGSWPNSLPGTGNSHRRTGTGTVGKI